MLENRQLLTNLKFTFLELPQQDPNWYSMLSANLSEEQKKSLQQILTTAEQKRNQKRSDAIEKSGGESHLIFNIYLNLKFCPLQAFNSLSKQFLRTSISAALHQIENIN